MSELSGALTAAGARERAVALAGALAELGVTALSIDGRVFAARATNLPGELLTPGSHILDVPSPRTRFMVTRDAIAWVAGDTGSAAALKRALGASPPA